MIQTIEAVIDEHGTVRLQEGITLSTPRRALVIILDEEPSPGKSILSQEESTVIMPKMSVSAKEGTLLGWRKKDGERVSVGEVIAVIDTDKSTVEVEAEVAGVLHTKVQSGQTLPVGYTIAIIRRGSARA